MHSRVWRLAAPMILSNLSIPILGIVDTAVMGYLPEPYYIGAVAIAALVFSFIYWGFGFLRMSTTGLVAQAYGRNQCDELGAILGRALLIGCCVSVLILLMQKPIAAMTFYFIDASIDVETNAAAYFFIRVWSAPAVLATYALIGWFLGTQNAYAAMWILLITNIVNLVLDILFVVYFDWAVEGVAWASLIAEYSGVLVGLSLCQKQSHRIGMRFSWRDVVKLQALRRMMSINYDIFIRTVCLIFTFAFFTAQGAKKGDIVLAANAVLMNFQTFMAYGLDGFAHAAEALVGGAVGAKDKSAFWGAVKVAGFWSIIVAVIFTAIYGLAGQHIIMAMTDLEAVRSAAFEYLPWVIVSPLISVWSFLLDGIFIGATRSVEMRNTMLIATFGFFLPAWYFLDFMGNHGLWFALLIYMAARGVSMACVLTYLHKTDKLFRAHV